MSSSARPSAISRLSEMRFKETCFHVCASTASNTEHASRRLTSGGVSPKKPRWTSRRGTSVWRNSATVSVSYPDSTSSSCSVNAVAGVSHPQRRSRWKVHRSQIQLDQDVSCGYKSHSRVCERWVRASYGSKTAWNLGRENPVWRSLSDWP